MGVGPPEGGTPNEIAHLPGVNVRMRCPAACVQARVFDVRDRVAEPVNEHHFTFDAISPHARLRPGQPDELLLCRTQFADRRAATQMRRDRGENVAPMKGVADRLQKVISIFEPANRFDFFPRQCEGQHTVVRPDEKIIRRLHRDGLARAADTRSTTATCTVPFRKNR